MRLFERKNKRMVITADAFACLVSGLPIQQDGVELIMDDIGFPTMLEIIRQARERKVNL